MEDGENGAKRLWNGDIQEKSTIFCGNFKEKMTTCLKWVVRRANQILTSAFSRIL